MSWNEGLSFFEHGAKVGSIDWGDHVGVSEPVNFIEVHDGAGWIVVSAEEFIRLLGSLRADEPFEADLHHYIGCANFPEPCGGPVESLPGAFRWNPLAPYVLVIRGLHLDRRDFQRMIRWLAEQPPWGEGYHRPFRVEPEERERFQECITLAARLAA